MLPNTIPRRKVQDAAAKAVVAVEAREAIVEAKATAREKALHKVLPKGRTVAASIAVEAKRATTPPRQSPKHNDYRQSPK